MSGSSMLSIHLEDGSFSVVVRESDVRFLVWSHDVLIIGRFSYKDIKNLMKNNEVVNGLGYPIDYAYNVNKTALDCKNRKVLLHLDDSIKEIQFSVEDWDKFINYLSKLSLK